MRRSAVARNAAYSCSRDSGDVDGEGTSSEDVDAGLYAEVSQGSEGEVDTESSV